MPLTGSHGVTVTVGTALSLPLSTNRWENLEREADRLFPENRDSDRFERDIVDAATEGRVVGSRVRERAVTVMSRDRREESRERSVGGEAEGAECRVAGGWQRDGRASERSCLGLQLAPVVVDDLGRGILDAVDYLIAHLQGWRVSYGEGHQAGDEVCHLHGGAASLLCTSRWQ